jgi:hypothetical protein
VSVNKVSIFSPSNFLILKFANDASKVLEQFPTCIEQQVESLPFSNWMQIFSSHPPFSSIAYNFILLPKLWQTTGV